MSHPTSRTLATLCVALAASAASAESSSPAAPGQAFERRVDNRQDRQEQRIEKGVQSGALTGPETRHIGQQQAGIVRAEARAESDGKITRREAVRLEHRQDQASRTIARTKHNDRVRRQ
jgi:hypothetical protein